MALFVLLVVYDVGGIVGERLWRCSCCWCLLVLIECLCCLVSVCGAVGGVYAVGAACGVW